MRARFVTCTAADCGTVREVVVRIAAVCVTVRAVVVLIAAVCGTVRACIVRTAAVCGTVRAWLTTLMAAVCGMVRDDVVTPPAAGRMKRWPKRSDRLMVSYLICKLPREMRELRRRFAQS